MVWKAIRTKFTCNDPYSVLLQPKKLNLHPPYMAVNYPWCTSMFRWSYAFRVPSINVPADGAQPMLLVFIASCRSAQQILKTVSTLMVYSVRWTIRFWGCRGLSPKSMAKVLSEEVTTAQNALPPDFEGELSLFASGTPVSPAAVKALDKRFEQTTKHAKEIDKQVIKQEAKQDAKQAATVASTLKVAGKRTGTSSQLSRLMESPFPLLSPDENPQHDITEPVVAGTPKTKAS